MSNNKNYQAYLKFRAMLQDQAKSVIALKIRLPFLVLYFLRISLTSVEKFHLSPSQCFPSPVISHRIFQKENNNVHTFAFWWLLAVIVLMLPRRWWRPRGPLQNHVKSIIPANESQSLYMCLGVVSEVPPLLIKMSQSSCFMKLICLL